uniref:Uncharacterized protein n=1 Tax=Musa acuminata subsp. malaccensis TaxID=214687 RepID=A0A804KNH9_MUSAM
MGVPEQFPCLFFQEGGGCQGKSLTKYFFP